MYAGAIDRYGRTLAKVECNGVNVNAEQVRTGQAWAYYATIRSGLPAMQAKAQADGVGLWAVPGAIKPAAWRKMTPR